MIKKTRKTLFDKENREELKIFSKIETIVNASRNLVTKSPNLSNSNRLHTHVIYQLAASCSEGVSFVYTPAHMDTAQNEMADVLAKLAVFHEAGKRTISNSLNMCWENNRNRSEASFSKTMKKLEKARLTSIHISKIEIDIRDNIAYPKAHNLYIGGVDEMLKRYSREVKVLDTRRMFCLLDNNEETFRWRFFPCERKRHVL